jgi:hypothetical protein
MEAFKKQLTLDKQKEHESDTAWNNRSVAAWQHCIDGDTLQIESGIAQHLVKESNFNYLQMPLLNHFSEHICQHGNLLNLSSELPEKPIMDVKQAYQQSNRYEPACQIVQTKAQQDVFHYHELNANIAKQCPNNDMPLTEAPIKQMMEIR